MPKKIWDIIQKYFLSLNKTQTYGSNTCPPHKIKMSEKLEKQRQRKEKKIIVYTYEMKTSL